MDSGIDQHDRHSLQGAPAGSYVGVGIGVVREEIGKLVDHDHRRPLAAGVFSGEPLGRRYVKRLVSVA